MIANELSRAGQNVRKYYQRRLTSDPSKDYYYMLRNTPNNETIIVEYGFLDAKTGDDVALLKNNYRTLTEAVVKALANYIGVPYIAPGGIDSNYYIVKKGDTLYSIANYLGVTVNELMAANNLSTSNLNVGQSLVIPKKVNEDAEAIYTVKSGDTLYKIANLFGISVNKLKALNNLTGNTLSIGQQLKVSTSVQEPENPEVSENTYIVQSGDTLYSLARKLGVSVDDLKQANNKTSNTLSIGEILIIPEETYTTKTHTVKSGDTLWNIAKIYNTTVDAIKELNNLVNNTLSIGMILNIPD